MYVCILNKLRSSKAQNIFLFQRHVFTYFEDRTHSPTHNQYFIEHILGVADRSTVSCIQRGYMVSGNRASTR